MNRGSRDTQDVQEKTGEAHHEVDALSDAVPVRHRHCSLVSGELSSFALASAVARPMVFTIWYSRCASSSSGVCGT